MNDAPLSARDEWKRYWPIVLAGFVGISFAAVPMQTVALFIDPVGDEFGWTRTQFSLGASIFALCVIPFSPFAGALQDRLGPRRMALTGALFCTASLSLLGFTTGSLNLWIGQWAFFGLAELLLKPTVWLAIVTSVFVHARGMATALVLCGTAMAQTILPILTFALIEEFGWRTAYVLLGLGWGGSTLLLVFFCFHDVRQFGRNESAGGSSQRDARPRELPGLTLWEALRCVSLYRIAIALMVATCLSVAVVTHKISILNEMGISRRDAALIAATAGFSSIAGKLFAGWIYDRSESTWIAVTAFGLSTIGYILLLEPLRSPFTIIFTMILFGLSAGATLQAGMYLTAQYCGQKRFGTIFGAKSSLTALGIGCGPLLSGLIVDNFGTYDPLFVIAVPMSFVAVLLIYKLGPYPDWSEQEAERPQPVPG